MLEEMTDMSVTPISGSEPIIRSDSDLRRFQEMVSETQRRAYSMALQLTRNPTEAEDLVQDFLRDAIALHAAERYILLGHQLLDQCE